MSSKTNPMPNQTKNDWHLSILKGDSNRFSQTLDGFVSTRLISITYPQANFRDLYQNILTSKKVKLVIESISRENNISKKSLELQSKKILETMRGDFHMPLLRFLAWFFRKIYRAMYENILIDERGLFALQSTMKEISEKSIPLVLLPTQRSYLDFMIITYLMFGKKIFSLILIF